MTFYHISGRMTARGGNWRSQLPPRAVILPEIILSVQKDSP